MRLATLKRFLREPWIDDLLELCRIDAAASNGNLFHYEFCRKALAELSEESMKPPPLLTGRDLIALGHKPGPVFRDILSALEEAQLEGTVASRDDALRFVRSRFPSP
jgi:poly(A) polymerase